MSMLPQEIQVWYVLPALRRELARVLINEHKFSQKKVASMMGVSEGAVSQYLSSKRGTYVKFDSDIIHHIGLAAKKIVVDNSAAMEELIRLSEIDSVKHTVCQIHFEQEPSISRTCDICFR